jgi:hypothetical protein
MKLSVKITFSQLIDTIDNQKIVPWLRDHVFTHKDEMAITLAKKGVYVIDDHNLKAEIIWDGWKENA